jgi:dihydrodipicolinate synthase/N-acetylneuraminate lyase
MEGLFEGIYCVSVTAFKEDESLDEERTTAHLDRVIKAGVDDLLFPGFLLGAVGVVSGAANIAPAIPTQLHRFLKEKNIEEARALWYKYLPLANLVGPLKSDLLY